MDQAVNGLESAFRVLEGQGWFSERGEKTRSLLRAIAKLRHFDKDEPVYLAGDPPDGAFGLVSGSLNISFPRNDGEDYTVHRAGHGFWIGDVALLSKKVRLVSVRAAEQTIMVQLPARELGRLLDEQPRLYADFYALTYENFETALRIISNLAITSTEKRIADRLVLEVEARGDEDGWISVSQPELAELLAVSLPTLQRVMRRFAGAGLVRKSYARLQVIDRDALGRICRG